jgi:hypothetical protein
MIRSAEKWERVFIRSEMPGLSFMEKGNDGPRREGDLFDERVINQAGWFKKKTEVRDRSIWR